MVRLINKNVMGKKPEIIRDKLKDKTIRDISRIFETKNEERKKKKYTGRINKDRIIKDNKTLFETKEEEKKKGIREKERVL